LASSLLSTSHGYHSEWRDIEIDTAFVHYTYGNDIRCGVMHERLFLDPAFWQALGKARGWTRGWSDKKYLGTHMVVWLEHWHRFIDHTADGKDVESFFASLA
jgi:hypothetical protein